MKPLIILSIFISTIFACNTKNEVLVEVKHNFNNNPPFSIVYTIDEQQIKVQINQKKLPFGLKKTSYSKTLSSEQIEAFKQFLITQKVDTLQPSYQEKTEEDLIQTTINFKLPNKKNKQCVLINTSVPVTDNLFNYMDELIDNSSFKFGKQN